jgi:hypothetical protein
MDRKIVTCVICSKPVSLEVARIDENGQAVHEECYMERVQAKPPREERKK